MTSTTDLDTNVDNYSIEELLTILNLDSLDPDDILDATNNYIQKFTQQNKSYMVSFFQDMQTKLLSPTDPDRIPLRNNIDAAGGTATNQQTSDWIEHEALPQSDITQRNKNTDRVQKIDVYDNEQVPMNRQKVAVTNSTLVPIVQDSLNPTLKNTTERMMNLDSQFRQPGSNSATDYTMDLSDHLQDVLSLRLFSFQIPVTWYVYDATYGNTTFWVTSASDLTDPTTVVVPVVLSSGNYPKIADLAAALQLALHDAGFHVPATPTGGNIPTNGITYNIASGKLTFHLAGVTFTDPTGILPSFQVTSTATATATPSLLLFFDPTAQYHSQPQCLTGANQTLNQTLGWALGFRGPQYPVAPEPAGDPADAAVDLIGPRYLIVVLDDYNQNHLHNGLVSIAELSKVVKLPSYYSADLRYRCTAPILNPPPYVDTGVNSGEIWADSLPLTYAPTQQILPNFPRTLTQSQIYTINEIIKNNQQNTQYLAKAPTTSDVFALLSIKGGLTPGELYSEISGSLQVFRRQYFGPVNIDRLRLSLLDDKGRVLNLNGCDWSITLLAEMLYQY